MSTTAYYRTLAADHESNLEWGRAADAWQKAIDLYPQNLGSDLTVRDLDLMEERKEACLKAYFPD